MKNPVLISETYNSPRGLQPVFHLALLLLTTEPLQAETVHRWTDDAGTTHFSDTAPPGTVRNRHQLQTAPAPEGTVQGLRSGERAALEAIDRRLARQHLDARHARRQHDSAVDVLRKACRERRERQRATGNHAGRRTDIAYLRRNCW